MKGKRTSKKTSKTSFLRQNKAFFGFFIVLFAGLIVLQATFAWKSYAEWNKNHMQTNSEAIAVKVIERFTDDSLIQYTSPTQKEVRIKNISNRPAIVRARLKESYLPLAIDLTHGEGQGNGSLATKAKEKGDKEIEVRQTETWATGSLLQSGKKKNGELQFYIADKPIIKDQVYQFDQVGRPSALKGFSLQFDPAVKQLEQVSGNAPAWYFLDGFFYYSKVLEGKQTTSIDLLKSVSQVDAGLSNRFKHALYNIEVEAYGVTPSSKGLKKWSNNNDLLNMYMADPNFNQP